MLLAFMLIWPRNNRTTWALSLTRLSTKIILLSFSSTLTSRKSWRPCARGDPPCSPPVSTVGTCMMASMSISCLESPGQKNFEKREVFPTFAEPNKSTMNSSDGQSPDFLNMKRLASVSVLEGLNTDVWKIFGIAINQSNIICVD